MENLITTRTTRRTPLVAFAVPFLGLINIKVNININITAYRLYVLDAVIGCELKQNANEG